MAFLRQSKVVAKVQGDFLPETSSESIGVGHGARILQMPPDLLKLPRWSNQYFGGGVKRK
jgi:hypothetical protein